MDVAQDKDNPSLATSPHSNGSSNGSSTPKPPPPPVSTSTPFPTTFVQADTSTFKQVVQILTGTGTSNSSATRGGSGGGSIPPIKSTGQKKPGFKLFERRNSLKNGLMINTLTPGGYSPNSPRNHELLSPSILDFLALVLKQVTPLKEDDGSNLCKSPSPSSVEVEEDKAIAQKKFYFHPSPRTEAEPQLLPLFPVTSPRLSDSSA